ncbi:RNA 2'-phosphotransferase [Acetobacter sp.]|uniref:RNA 2'-phosphotransferase n=1 Tax=Acetobacter sp. TaxID=440 RepID=UPI0039E94B1D
MIKAAQKTGRKFNREALQRVVVSNDKQRFTLSQDGQRIRAAQGHSLAVDLDLPEGTPSETLWHGTARSNLDSIFSTGLNAGNRQFVHLSSDVDTAKMVGARHGKPVVLKVLACQMWDEGYAFYQADNGVWLTAHVPVQFLSFC